MVSSLNLLHGLILTHLLDLWIIYELQAVTRGLRPKLEVIEVKPR